MARDGFPKRLIDEQGPRIPGNSEDLVGGYRAFDPEREDTVLFGHPEEAGIYSSGFDNSDPYLEASPYRMDLNYVSPEEVRKRSKGTRGNW